MLNFENCDKAIFDGAPPYDIPVIRPEDIEIHKLQWVPFNYAKTAKLLTKSETSKIKSAREKTVREKPDYQLGIGLPWGNAQERRTARMNRLATRVQKRKR